MTNVQYQTSRKIYFSQACHVTLYFKLVHHLSVYWLIRLEIWYKLINFLSSYSQMMQAVLDYNE